MKITTCKIRTILQSFLCFFLATILSVPTFAISDALWDEYGINGIYYYDPTGSNSGCYSGDVTLAGSTAAEKIWSGLTTFMTPEQAAGVMGNMSHESNRFNPVQHEKSQHDKYWNNGNFDIINDTGRNHDPGRPYGIGLIQWSWERRVDLLKYIQNKDASLMTYFLQPETYSPGYEVNGDKFIELAGEDVFNRLVQYELEFLKDELNTYSSYKGIFKTTTVEEAAEYFLYNVEKPKNPEGSKATRIATAVDVYNSFNGASLSPSGGFDNIGGSSVTIIGDSITVGSTSQLQSKLPQVKIDAEVGRQFTTGIDIAKSIDLRKIVVFALGTNNNALTSSQVEEIINIVGPERNLYFVTNYGNYDYTNNNQLLNDAASNNSNVNIIDWSGAVSIDPSKYISSDGVHPTDAGRTLFANLVYNAITASNLTSNGCTVSGDLISAVKAYAWPTYHSAPFTERMPAYAEVVAKRQSERKYVGGSVDGVAGIDCGGFVTTVMQESGFSVDYNGYISNVPPQERWVRENGWTLINADENSVVDTSLLQPGDVAFSGELGSAGHTFLYVGEVDGFDSNIASASYSRGTNAYARAPMAGTESLTYKSSTEHIPVRWYRKG